jgi:hypothetical protein
MATFDARPSQFTQLTSTSDWEYLLSSFMPQGGAVDASIGNAMNPSLDTPGRNAVIADGVAVIKGQLWRCDAAVSTPIPAASAQNRIDRLVLRLTRGATTSATVVQPVVITGTPSGSPVEPPIVRTTTGIWDLPISSWTSTSAGAITSLVDERDFVNDPWHSLGTLAGYTGFGRYRMTLWGETELDLGVVGGGSNGGNVSFSVTLPLSYRLNNGASSMAYGLTTNVPGNMTAAGGPPRVVASTNGAVSIVGPASTSAAYWGQCFVPTS